MLARFFPSCCAIYDWFLCFIHSIKQFSLFAVSLSLTLVVSCMFDVLSDIFCSFYRNNSNFCFVQMNISMLFFFLASVLYPMKKKVSFYYMQRAFFCWFINTVFVLVSLSIVCFEYGKRKKKYESSYPADNSKKNFDDRLSTQPNLCTPCFVAWYIIYEEFYSVFAFVNL